MLASVGNQAWKVGVGSQDNILYAVCTMLAIYSYYGHRSITNEATNVEGNDLEALLAQINCSGMSIHKQLSVQLTGL